jgi:hypothetical protein
VLVDQADAPGDGGNPGPRRHRVALSRRERNGDPRAPFLPWSLAFDGTSFFETVACDLCPGTLMRIPASGAPPLTMAAGGFVAVDDTCAFYTRVQGVVGNGICSVDTSYAGSASP